MKGLRLPAQAGPLCAALPALHLCLSWLHSPTSTPTAVPSTVRGSLCRERWWNHWNTRGTEENAEIAQ